MSAIFDIVEHDIPASHIREYARATSESQEDVLRLHVKQYVPKDNPNPDKGDITVIGAHANGFPKEVYEPLYEDFYAEAKKRGVRIRSIWIADCAWQGHSSFLNRSKLGNDPGWVDHARDLMHMINTFRMPRPLVAMAHSFGGNAIIRLAVMHPRLFTTIVLLDPVIAKLSTGPGEYNNGPAGQSLYRRDVWPSRKAAGDAFRKNSWYKSWDERALERWVEFGLRKVRPEDGDDGEVTLSTPVHQEVFTYLRPSWPAYDSTGKHMIKPEHSPDLDSWLHIYQPVYPFYRAEPPAALKLLPGVRPSVLYIFGSHKGLFPKSIQDEDVAVTGTGIGGSGGAAIGRVKGIMSRRHGHLIPLEAPRLCATEAAEWIRGEMERWWEDERAYEQWARLPQQEKSTVNDEYRKYLGVPDRLRKDKRKAKL